MDSVGSASQDATEAHRQTRSEALAGAVGRVEGLLHQAGPPVACPALVVLSGVPGSGKSHLARLVQPRLPATIIETDVIRRQLFPRPRYTAPESGWVYAVSHALIVRLLERGQSVIFDATNLRESGRRSLYRIAESRQARLVIVRTVAPDEVIRRRLRARNAQPDPDDHSDADVTVYETLRVTEEPIRRPHLVVDTSQDCDQAADRIVRQCRGDDMTASQSQPPYTVLEHTADLALRVWGDSMEDLFANAAAGMFAQMADLAQLSPSVRRDIAVEGGDNEALLVAWLSELLYLREVRREAYVRFQVRFCGQGQLQGVAEGGPWQSFARPVKAATYHGLKIKRRGRRYEATIVFDV